MEIEIRGQINDQSEPLIFSKSKDLTFRNYGLAP
jgi:hypothetical protein